MALPRAPPPTHESHDTTLTLGLPYSPVSAKQHARKPRLVEGFRVVPSSPIPTDDATPCTECGKRFTSRKALYGHMRCHPEREWRGIMPPSRFLHGHGGAGRFTVQEREGAASLLMLSAGGSSTGKGKKSISAAFPSPSGMESGGTSASAAPDRPANYCDHGHKCGVCNRGFASGQALGGHKRCHLERDVVLIATAGSSGSAMPEAVVATVLDLNLPPPATPLALKRDDVQGSSMHEMLDLKLWYV